MLLPLLAFLSASNGRKQIGEKEIFLLLFACVAAGKRRERDKEKKEKKWVGYVNGGSRPPTRKRRFIYPHFSGLHMSLVHWPSLDIFGKCPFNSFLPFSNKHLAMHCFFFHICQANFIFLTNKPITPQNIFN